MSTSYPFGKRELPRPSPISLRPKRKKGSHSYHVPVEVVVPVSDWILALATWSDTGIWRDAEIWKDNL